MRISDWSSDVCSSDLFVYTRVVSANHAGFVTIDAGSKSLSMDGPAPVVAFGAPAGNTYSCVGDEFGRLTLPPGSAPLPVGAMGGLVVPPCGIGSAQSRDRVWQNGYV